MSADAADTSVCATSCLTPFSGSQGEALPPNLLCIQPAVHPKAAKADYRRTGEWRNVSLTASSTRPCASTVPA